MRPVFDCLPGQAFAGDDIGEFWADPLNAEQHRCGFGQGRLVLRQNRATFGLHRLDLFDQ
ncbi:hypothetical protein X743_33520 [Mesorhizobium sp. LNHC252B00]|nr:hypothetical protein X743_33520 [Mesorhizobium sp. LNHC252B00]